MNDSIEEHAEDRVMLVGQKRFIRFLALLSPSTTLLGLGVVGFVILMTYLEIDFPKGVLSSSGFDYLGVFIILFYWVVPIVGLILGVIAFMGLRHDKQYTRNRELAVTGIILSILYLIFVPVLVMGFMWSQSGKRSEFDYQGVCTSNLQQIGKAICIYGQDYRADLPVDLDALAKENVAPSQLFYCPMGSLAKNQEDYRYVYLGAGLNSNKGDPSTIIAYDSQPRHDGKRNVLMLNGMVQPMTEEAFQEALRKQPKGVEHGTRTTSR